MRCVSRAKFLRSSIEIPPWKRRAIVNSRVTLEGWPLGIVTNNGPIDCGASFGAGNYGMCGRGREMSS